MKLSDFDYHLPKELIAQEGLAEREKARLFALHKDGHYEHRQFKNIFEYFQKGDLLILNNTRVSKAKLIGKKETGGKVDCLVLPDQNGSEKKESKVREVLARGNNIKKGTVIVFQSKNGKAELTGKVIEKIKGARCRIEFSNPSAISSFGEVPLPPYIKKTLPDSDRYQTVFSKEEGSLAAPTAGLHFTTELMNNLKSRGVELAFLTLHVGIGTFAPIQTENLDDWKMHPEYFQINKENAEIINGAIKSKRRIFAVGTTTIRTLESLMRNEPIKAQEGWTDIFIYPGYKFKFPYSGMVTNFHLPKSTLILLVSALVGRERILSAYEEAIRQKYRFYSLGDGMLILL